MPNNKINLKEDVSRPKKIIPSKNSKNIIVSSQPIVKDPDIMENQTTEEVTLVPSHKLVINPINDLEESKIDQPLKIDSDNLTEPNNVNQSLDDQAVVLDEEIKQENSSNSQVASLDLSAELQKTDQKKIQSDETDHEIKHQLVEKSIPVDVVADLINSKTYFLPIKTLTRRKNKQFFIISLVAVIIILFLWLEIALYYHLITLFNLKSIF